MIRLIFLLIFLNLIYSCINVELQTNDMKSKRKSIRNFCQPFADIEWGEKVCGIGILSRDRSENCFKWKYSQWNEIKSIEETRLCKKHENNYFCATGNKTWDYCKNIKCARTTNDRTCEANIDWTYTDLSIDIDFSKISSNNELLILSYSIYDQCLISKSCQNCDVTNTIISNHFINCIQIPGIGSYGNIINYSFLSKFYSSIFYLLPVVDNNTIGSIVKLELNTRLSKPNIPSNLQLISATSNSISIQWDQPIPNNKFGVAESYQIQLILRPILLAINTTILNYISFINLKENTEYCFIIIAINEDGHSLPTLPFCVRTKAVKPIINSIIIKETISQINILYNINLTIAIENYYFLIQLKDIKNKCLFYIIISLSDIPKNTKYLNESNKIKLQELKKCSSAENLKVNISSSKINITLIKKEPSKKSKMEIHNIIIYSINSMGIHEIGNKIIQSPTVIYLIYYPIIFLAILLLIIILFYMAFKRGYLSKLTKFRKEKKREGEVQYINENQIDMRKNKHKGVINMKN